MARRLSIYIQKDIDSDFSQSGLFERCMYRHDGDATAEAEVLVWQLRHICEDKSRAGNEHHQTLQEATSRDSGNQTVHR